MSRLPPVGSFPQYPVLSMIIHEEDTRRTIEKGGDDGDSGGVIFGEVVYGISMLGESTYKADSIVMVAPREHLFILQCICHVPLEDVAE